MATNTVDNANNLGVIHEILHKANQLRAVKAAPVARQGPRISTSSTRVGLITRTQIEIPTAHCQTTATINKTEVRTEALSGIPNRIKATTNSETAASSVDANIRRPRFNMKLQTYIVMV